MIIVRNITIKFKFICLFALIFIFFWYFVLAFKTQASNQATVSATVTAQNISVGISDASISFGVMQIGTSKNTTAAGGMLNDSQKAANDGNVAETLNFKGNNSTSTGAGWTLGSSPGSETYTVKWCTVDCDSSPSWYALGVGYTNLVTNIAVGDTQWFDLQLHTPTSTVDYNQQTVEVTLQATSFP